MNLQNLNFSSVWCSNFPSVASNFRSVCFSFLFRTKEMPSKAKIPATLRNVVWLKYVGETDSGKCFCCHLERISRGNYECGHIVSEKNGGLVHINNLRPVCGLCNKSMG